jgi:hypothetical protein
MKRLRLHRNCFKLHSGQVDNSQLSNDEKSNSGKQSLIRRLLSGTLLSGTLMLHGSLLVGSVVALALNLTLAPVAVAYTVEDALTVYRVDGEDYTALSRRAEIAARAFAQQWFDSDILLTRVIVTVLGDNGGQMAPILTLNVSRNDWRSRPDPQQWATYYYSTRTLLELNNTPTTATQPAANVTTPMTSPMLLPAPTTPIPASTTAPNRSGSTPSDQIAPPPSSPPSINIPATPPGQVGLPRSILR